MKRSLTALLACAVAMPALAQDAAADWDMIQDTRKNMLVAFAQFDTGVAIATRCNDGGFEVALTGLPPAGRATSRPLRIAFGDEEPVERPWNVAMDDTVAISETPAPFARKLREGGRLRIGIPNGATDGRTLLYDLQLPASSASIDRTLTACDRPLVDPRDAELALLSDEGIPVNLTWSVRPSARYPSTRYARGFAVITCLTNPDGSLRNCAIESEHPHEAGFGEAALASARRARLQNLAEPGAPVPLTQIQYKARFLMEGYATAEDLARQREAARLQREERRARRANGG